MISIVKVLAGLGILWSVQLLYRFLRFIRIFTRASSLGRYHYEAGGQCPWAFITGSSDGIGRALAHELARSGFNIILHGRNAAKLQTVKQSLQDDFPKREVRIVISDAMAPGPQMLSSIKTIVNDLKVLHLTILVNNVGGPAPMEPLYKTFDANSSDDIDGVLSLNLRFTTQLTAAILPLLMQHNKPALVLNIGSVSDAGFPWLSMYSATKAFIASWSRALAREMRATKKDVEVMCITPAMVTSTGFRKEKSTIMLPDAGTFARASLQRVGCGEIVVAGYWAHGVMLSFLSWLPESVVGRIVEQSMRDEIKNDKKKD